MLFAVRIGQGVAVIPRSCSVAIANTVLAAGIAFSSSSCVDGARDLESAEITYHEFPGHRMMNPEFELTLETPGVVRLMCKRFCAASGEVVERIPEAKMREVFDSLETSGFFNQPRDRTTANLTHGGRDAITYRDRDRIHEVIDVGARLPSLVSLFRQLINVDQLTRPSVELYRRRLASGWNVNSVDESQRTAVESAVWASDLASVDFLVAHGAIPDAGTMFALAFTGDAEIALRLLVARPLDPTSSEGRTLLVGASSHQHVALVRLLLDHGFDVNAADDQGDTALMVAVHGGGWDLIEYLLSRHANPNALDRSGRTMLWLAAQSYNTAGVALLVRHGARVNERDASGRTALMHAAEGCLAWNVEALLKAGADPLLTDRNGRTAAAFGLPPSDPNHDKCAGSQNLLARAR